MKLYCDSAQWRSQRLCVGGGETPASVERGLVEAPKGTSLVGSGDGCPLPSRLGGVVKRREFPQWGPGLPGPQTHFLQILGHILTQKLQLPSFSLVGWRLGGVSFPQPTRGLGSVVSSPIGVKRTFCVF